MRPNKCAFTRPSAQAGRTLPVDLRHVPGNEKPRAKAVQQTVVALITSGIQEQLHHGDTIGVWTFNEKLYTGKFPLQEWTLDRAGQIASRLVEFLQRQKYEKKSNFAEVMPRLNRLVNNSDRITVILFSDCSRPIGGTIFDTELNAIYAAHRQVMKQTRVPFVTVPRAQKGRFIGARGTMALQPVEFPSFPPEPNPSGTTTTNRVGDDKTAPPTLGRPARQ